MPTLNLYDASGNLVATATGNASDGRNDVIDWTALTSGSYRVQIVGANAQATEETPASSGCHAYQKGPDGTWVEMACHEGIGSDAAPTPVHHKSASHHHADQGTARMQEIARAVRVAVLKRADVDFINDRALVPKIGFDRRGSLGSLFLHEEGDLLISCHNRQGPSIR